jgi:hypothetical protein
MLPLLMTDGNLSQVARIRLIRPIPSPGVVKMVTVGVLTEPDDADEEHPLSSICAERHPHECTTLSPS